MRASPYVPSSPVHEGPVPVLPPGRGGHLSPRSSAFRELCALVERGLPCDTPSTPSWRLHAELLYLRETGRLVPVHAFSFLSAYCRLLLLERNPPAECGESLSDCRGAVEACRVRLDTVARTVGSVPSLFRSCCHPLYMFRACALSDRMEAEGFLSPPSEVERLEIYTALSFSFYYWNLWEEPEDLYRENAEAVFSRVSMECRRIYGTPSRPSPLARFHKGRDMALLALLAWRKDTPFLASRSFGFLEAMAARVRRVEGWDQSLFVEEVPSDVFRLGYWKWALRRMSSVSRLHRECGRIRKRNYDFSEEEALAMEDLRRTAEECQKAYVYNASCSSVFPLLLKDRWQRLYAVRNVLLVVLTLLAVFVSLELMLTLIFIMLILRI